MSKQYHIRWTENDSKELSRAVRNFNAKVKRLEQKHSGTNIIIPEKLSVKEMKGLINTRRDLQRELKSLQRFSQRGAEEIVTIPNTDNNITLTQWQKKEMSIRAGIVNRKRNQRLKEIEESNVTSRGVDLGYTRGDIGMGRADKLALKPTKAFTPKMHKVDVNKKFNMLKIHSQSDYFTKKDIQYRENYIKGLLETYNEKDIKDVIDYIRKMDLNDFVKQGQSMPDMFEYASGLPDNEVYNSYVEKIKSDWIPKGDPNRKKKVGKKK